MQDDQPPGLTNPSQFDILLRGRGGLIYALLSIERAREH
jgi:hypothetical protein